MDRGVAGKGRDPSLHVFKKSLHVFKKSPHVFKKIPACI
jgi:hypothetical protein